MTKAAKQITPGTGDPGVGADQADNADQRARTTATKKGKTTGKTAKVGGIQSVERALAILEALAEANDELTLSELAQAVQRRIEVSLSTVYRLLSVLAARDYVWQSGPRGRYALGPKLPKLAESAGTGTGRQSDLRRKARPIMRALGAQVKETINLVELHGKRAIYVDQALAERSVASFAHIGERAPLYATGAGKILLAFQTNSFREAYLATTTLKKKTDNTITRRADLLAKLEQIRERGFALDEGEFDAEVRCVAAPVRNRAGRVVAALSVSAPASRWNIEDMKEKLGPAVVEAARDLSAQLGYRS